jgi:hypothetical protein
MQRRVEIWAEIQFSDILIAYRKAKADCYFERSYHVAEAFASYEQNLIASLRELHAQVLSGEVGRVLSDHPGRVRVVPKRLKSTKTNPANSHGFFSDAERAFKSLRQAKLSPEFRLIGEFDVEVHIISALWINLVGHQIDAQLTSNAYGSRLRRTKYQDGRPQRSNYHLDAVGSFEPYFNPYRGWRDTGLKAIDTALAGNQDVVALTLDFTSYYHNIDPAFLASQGFLRRVGLSFNDTELQFTRQIVEFIRRWAQQSSAFAGDIPGLAAARGVPIGLTAVKIMANALLHELDKDILRNLSPIYYGRYVDDIFLVLSDVQSVASPEEMWRFICDRSSMFRIADSGAITIELPEEYKGENKLFLQPEKQKLFFLKGESGRDLLQSIAGEIRNLSSERRLLPTVDQLKGGPSARVLAATDRSADEPVSLRRADGLTLRRLGWSLQLRSLNILAKDLRPVDWVESRKSFYRFSRDHVIRPDRILEHLDYVPRLISLAVAVGDWDDARNIITSARRSLAEVQDASRDQLVTLNGQEINIEPAQLWRGVNDWLTHNCVEATLVALPWSSDGSEPRLLSRAAKRMLDALGVIPDAEALIKRSRALREADLARVSYKNHLKLRAARPRALGDDLNDFAEIMPNAEALLEFLRKSRLRDPDSRVCRLGEVAEKLEESNEVSLIPFFFPTRPYTSREVALYLPSECVFGDPDFTTERWAYYMAGVRGNLPTRWLRRGGEPNGDAPDRPSATLGSPTGELKILLGISSLQTSEETWSAAAAGVPDLSNERRERLATIINQAITAKPKPTHLLLPELSLPEPWVDTIAGVLQEAGISLVAGLDYEVQSGKVHSSAVLVLSDKRLGYPASVEIRQRKLQPSPGEELNLLNSHGLEWTEPSLGESKPVYMHDGFCFGVLVCSELQNVEQRLMFQGQVDAVFVLAWNQDLETFSALVDSASLDVHAHIALVNNRTYGDSRVRSPAIHSYERDVCRLRGGKNEHLVIAEVEIDRLRRQQSRVKRWRKPNDVYKPAPEGFRIAGYRWKIPD